MMRTDEKPSTKEISLFCDNCKYESMFFMTNKEIFDNNNIKQWCPNCQKIIIFNQFNGDGQE